MTLTRKGKMESLMKVYSKVFGVNFHIILQDNMKVNSTVPG
jgi:hypothetical protein